MTPSIEFKGVSKFFGNIIALKDISFKVFKGEITALLGDNGAGKSTLIKLLSGVHIPSEGEILLNGKVVNFKSPRQAVTAGIGTVYQDLALQSLMSVTRNFFLGREITKGIFLDMSLMNDITRKEMAKLGIDVADPTQPIGTMSGGQRQMLAMAKALILDAKVLLLDEPTAGLSPKYRLEIFDTIQRINKSGLPILMVEQNAKQALQISHRGYVLVDGSNRYTGTGAELSADPEVARMFLGSRG